MGVPSGEFTLLLQRVGEGDAEAQPRLLGLLYDELRRTAAGYMSRERLDHTLQPTALVNEAWVRLFEGCPPHSEDRKLFLGLAAKAMRNVLVDHARARDADKRGAGAERLPLDSVIASFEERDVDLLALDDALAKLTEVKPELARLVELRFFGGLTVPETAQAMGVSTPTLERRWRVARMWLQQELGEEHA